MQAGVLNHRYAAARAYGTIQQLLVLDDIWTDYLANATSPSIPQEDIEVLQAVRGEMRRLVTSAAEQCKALEPVIAERAEVIDRAFAEMIAQHALDYSARSTITTKLLARGGYTASVQAGLQKFVNGAAEEREIIARKMRSIENGEFTPGDMMLRCALLAAGIGVCLGGGVWAGAAGLFGASVLAGCWG